jgi:hypothetical protein
MKVYPTSFEVPVSVSSAVLDLHWSGCLTSERHRLSSWQTNYYFCNWFLSVFTRNIFWNGEKMMDAVCNGMMLCYNLQVRRHNEDNGAVCNAIQTLNTACSFNILRTEILPPEDKFHFLTNTTSTAIINVLQASSSSVPKHKNFRQDRS